VPGELARVGESDRRSFRQQVWIGLGFYLLGVITALATSALTT
jgi:hypothetical protein